MKRHGLKRRTLLGGLAAAALGRESEARIGMIFHGGAAVPTSTTIGYSVRIVMDVGGAVYTFNPDTPDSHTTVVNQDPFVSDFAGFTQGSVLTMRNDTPVITGSLRVLFRKDVSPDPTRIEIILECGYPVTDGTAANLGAFTLQILKNGVPQSIPYATVANPNATTTSAHFPQMGWFSRWRWNPTPRAEVRTRASLLPSGLNLLPNYSQAMATTLRSRAVGSSNGPVATLRYSSAFASGFGNDLNPVGVNEGCGIATRTGGVGDRPELGVTTDWCADYVITGSAAARTAMYVLGEVGGGEPYAIRSTTNGPPIDVVSTADNYWLSGGGAGEINTPTVFVPSGNTDLWELESNHLPNLSYVPYILTGDPWYLENLQFQANWYVGGHAFHRFFGWLLVESDPNSPVAANNATSSIPIFPNMRFSTRGLGWCIRDWAQALLATPASVPSWLQPKSYFQSALDQNRDYLMNNSGCPGGTGANHAYVLANYPNYAAWGSCPGAREFEQGFFVSYLMLGLGFLVNQAGQSSWQNYYEYVARLPIGLASGTSGWPYNWPSPYYWLIAPVTTDYNANPSIYTDFAGMWAENWQNQIFASDYWATGGNNKSVFPSWQPSTNYICNSWILEVRQGQPLLPNAGDVVSFTIAGSFSGSPVTVSHTVTSGDVAVAAALPWQDHEIDTGHHNGTVDDLIAKINASAVGTAGINASLTNNAGAISSSGYWFTRRSICRIYLTFNSAIVGNITVTGSYTYGGPNTASSVYIQSNGDPVHVGLYGSNLYGRQRSYMAAKTATSGSGSGPTGQTLQTPFSGDGSMVWYFAPEWKVDPFATPQPTVATAPRMAQVWTNSPIPPGVVGDGGAPQFGYPAQAWIAMNLAVVAGVPGSVGAASNISAVVLDWLSIDPASNMRFAMAIA